MSSRSKSWTSGPIAPAALHVDVAACGHRHDVVPPDHRARLGLEEGALPTDPQDEDPEFPGQPLEIADRLVHEGVIGHAIGPDLESPDRREHPGLRFRSAPALTLHLLGLVPEVDPHELGPDRGNEPDEDGRPHQVGDRVGDGDVVDEPRLLLGRERQAIDGVAGRPDHRGLGERPGQEPRRGPDVVREDLRGDEGGDETRDAQHDRDRDL